MKPSVHKIHQTTYKIIFCCVLKDGFKLVSLRQRDRMSTKKECNQPKANIQSNDGCKAALSSASTND